MAKYDIIFKAPKFDDQVGVIERARITALHNGVLIQNNAELYGNTEDKKAGAITSPTPRARHWNSRTMAIWCGTGIFGIRRL